MTTAPSKSLFTLSGALLLLALTAACGPGENSNDDAGNGGNADSGTNDAGTGMDAGMTMDAGQPTVPTVTANSPLNAATNVAINTNLTATFSEPMDPATLTAMTFTLTEGPTGNPVAGTVIYSNQKAIFWPADKLMSNGNYTATVTTLAKSAKGVALADKKSWLFTTGTMVAPGVPVNLGTAGGFAILAKSGVSTVPASAITGNVAVSPAAASYITGFSLTADATNVFSTSPQVTGKVYAADYASPTPSNLTTAVGDMEIAFTDAAGRPPDFTELAAGNVGGKTLASGTYKWGTGVIIPTDVTLNGNATDVWIFQIAQDLSLSNATKVTLTGGALAKNVFWQVAGKIELGTTSHMEGILLSQTSISMKTGASLNGRMLAQTAVDIDTSTIVQPAP